jgi:hypothetical protein
MRRRKVKNAGNNKGGDTMKTKNSEEKSVSIAQSTNGKTQSGAEGNMPCTISDTTQLMESNAPYPSIDEVESDSTVSLDSARTHVLEQMHCAARSTQAQESPLATLNAQANAAKAIAELVKAKVDIYKAYRNR